MGTMTKISKGIENKRSDEKTKRVVNFMGGNSYGLSPLETLKIVSASSIFGEPSYYRSGLSDSKVVDSKVTINDVFKDYSLVSKDSCKDLNTSTFMELCIDNALSFDFAGTLEWAKILRTDYNMRLNPQVIMVRAAIHEDRVAFTEENPNVFSDTNQIVMGRADEVINQITYFLFINNGNKNSIPNLLKRSWKKRIESMTKYEIGKYHKHGIGLINSIRICHANNGTINELMKNGKIELEGKDVSHEVMRMNGEKWKDILNTVHLGHMAILYNLRSIFQETKDKDLYNRITKELIAGVEKGKQFPFRYLSAYNKIKSEDGVNFKSGILDTLEECIDKSCENLPKLAGKSAFLSDNSGSAWGACNSEYGSMTIANINNLSSVIGAVNSEDGKVFSFGDELIEHNISKRNGLLKQECEISDKRGSDVGLGTENGIWLFFEKAINEKIHWDNIFIYSDQQAGHGGLYGTHEEELKYAKQGFSVKGTRYIDVAKLINEYRKKVNPKVNVFSIQTAGYDNMLIPEYGYRTNILYGWTGKELLFADKMIKFWDEHDKMKENSK